MCTISQCRLITLCGKSKGSNRRISSFNLDFRATLVRPNEVSKEIYDISTFYVEPKCEMCVILPNKELL